jgi:phosphoribosyl-AMP cyclohydrolase
MNSPAWLNDIKWDAQGLIPAIAQDYQTHDILMVAWMNAESLVLTAEQGVAVYWSRSRQELWRKGETSGHQQKVHEIRLDCDNDVIILKVDQAGGIACHTGRRSCFFKVLKDGQWHPVEPVLRDPKDIYGKHSHE